MQACIILFQRFQHAHNWDEANSDYCYLIKLAKGHLFFITLGDILHLRSGNRTVLQDRGDNQTFHDFKTKDSEPIFKINVQHSKVKVHFIISHHR